MNKREFFKTFVRDKKIAAVMPTPRHAINRILPYVPKDAKTVAEYGPGDGVITKHILDRLPVEATMIAIEQNQEFVHELAQIHDSRLHIKQGDALFINEYLQDVGIQKLDMAISGIPFSFLKHSEREHIIAQTYNALSSGGVFIVYQFSPLMLFYLKRWFAHVRLRLVLPFYFIMVATKS